MVLAGRIGWRKWLGGALVALLLIAGVSVTSFADLRIITESDDERFEMLVKDGRIMSRGDLSAWLILDCALEEVTYVYFSHYWQGPIAEFAAALDAEFAKLVQGDADVAEVPEFLGALFSSSTSGTTQVRVTPLGEETVAGYGATQYRVETGDGSQWKTHELVSISSDLLREIEAEIGDCTFVMMDLSQQLASLVPLGDTAVYSDPAYRALFGQGYPVRSITKMTMFGIDFEVESAVVEVSRDPLHDSEFAVPATSRRVDNLSTFFRD